ncbi:MAG TPA: hypothetical protein VKB39_03135 [Candidatus Baltobacteraceae bacterium]|nr:hypothetical protein [Candidatus Baltobacteraceae bacterium]
MQNVVPGAPQYAPASTAHDSTSGDAVTKVSVTITIASKSAAAAETHARHPRYFSPASRGLLVNAYTHGKRKIIAHAVVDISPGSAACGGRKTTPRTCTASIAVPPSNGDDFALLDYSTKPVSGKIPRGAHVVAYGRLMNKKVATSAKKNRFSVYLGGLIENLKAGPVTPISFPGDGGGHSAAVMVDPVDYGNNPISAGAKDPYANPITVKIVETGGTGHTRLSLNGGATATSVVLKYGSDTVEVEYDGGGAVGYGARVQLHSGKINNTGGASAVVAIAPFILGSTSADLSTGALALKGNGDYAKIQISDVNAPGDTTFSVTPQHCDAIASTSVFAQSSASSGSFSVIARGVAATPDPAGCTIAVSDGTSFLDLSVSNTYSGSLGSPVIATTPYPSSGVWPVEVTVGPDGGLWFAECGGAALGRVGAAPLSASNAIHEFALPVASPTAGPAGAYAGPDGNVWFTDEGTGNVGKMTTAGVLVHQYPVASATDEPAAVTVGSDGSLWFTNWTANYIGTLPASGSPMTQYSTNLTSSYAPNIALGPDGNLWFTENDVDKIGKITPGGAITEYDIPTASSVPWDITAGPDGAMWFTECNGGSGHNGAIGRIPVNAASGSDIKEFSLGMTGHQPVDITAGPDGALWFTYWNAAAVVGRITTAATPSTTTITEYAIPGASATYNGWGITSGPDGAIWFTDNIDNVMGRIAIGSTPAVGHANRLHRTGRSAYFASARARIRARHHVAP